MEEKFAFKRLKVWNKSVLLFEIVFNSIDKDKLVKSYRLKEQLYSCTSSIPMNIAEGAGRYSKKEFAHFLFIARGSLFEMLTLIHIYKNMKMINEGDYNNINDKAFELVKMLNKLISSIKQN